MSLIKKTPAVIKNDSAGMTTGVFSLGLCMLTALQRLRGGEVPQPVPRRSSGLHRRAADLLHNPWCKTPLVSRAGGTALGLGDDFRNFLISPLCYLLTIYLQRVLNSSFKMKSSGRGMLCALNCPMSFEVILSETETHRLLAVTLWTGGMLRDEQHTSAWPRAFLGEAVERWLRLPGLVPRLPRAGRDAEQLAPMKVCSFCGLRRSMRTKWDFCIRVSSRSTARAEPAAFGRTRKPSQPPLAALPLGQRRLKGQTVIELLVWQLDVLPLFAHCWESRSQKRVSVLTMLHGRQPQQQG